ncbi:MAG: hypothetical protein V4560_19010 [Bacteroidota bacterium]
MKVKESTVLLLLFFALFAKGQIPELKSNIPFGYDIKSSELYKEFGGKYDLLISHRYMGGWSYSEFSYDIIAFKGRKSYNILFFKMKDTKANGGHQKPQIKRELIDKRKADSILSVFNNNNFWTLNNDTLSINKFGKYYDADAHRYVDRQFDVSDGSADVFTVISKKEYLIVSAYEPEYYFEVLPEIKQRGRFINSKRAFLSVFPH